MNPKKIKHKMKVGRVLRITIGWLVAGVLLALYEHLLTSTADFTRVETYHLGKSLAGNILKTLLAGFSVAVVEVFYLREKFAHKPFAQVVAYKGAFYLLSILLLTTAVHCLVNTWYQADIFIVSCLYSYVLSPELLHNLVTWSGVVLFTLFLLEVNDKYGKGMLLNVIMGKYHQPIAEKRVFMFLDLKSSTSIAEELGHIKYFSLLNELFEDITYAILAKEGEIYQYVGDEVIVTWPLEKGKKNNNAIHLFYEIEQMIHSQSAKYLARYGLLPELKAGLHYGEVTTGEIGILKKEIIFTGDVLNTTSRIQHLCNLFKANLLISDQLKAQMQPEEHLHYKKIGPVQLRGKQKVLDIYEVNLTRRLFQAPFSFQPKPKEKSHLLLPK